ncbi:hypothetical protein CPL00366_CDS0071 [Klebsiella phage RareGolfball]
MTNEIKSGGKIVATIKPRQVIAFEIAIPGTDDVQLIDVPVWANTVAIDQDGEIWAYESVAEDIKAMRNGADVWADCGSVVLKAQPIGFMGYSPDWDKTKVDLRTMK